MKEPVWLTREDCLAIHEMMLAQYGGLAGVRDEGMLASALAKPRNRFAYGKPTLAEMAASYAAGIVLNHPFLDGNKRTGFMLAATFLELNGLKFIAEEVFVVERTLAFAAGAIDEAEYATWLKANVRKA
ncbi:MAG: type II toxin-antitoxin system death-on-curing family toxin [Verrucomicrobia bacterium]|nr:type II toxin-antitoxin system death-on-curing family toxin [Verrucomicrobiota bacterium]